MRVQGLAVFFCLTACASADVTPVWSPGGLSPKFTAVPKRVAKTSVDRGADRRNERAYDTRRLRALKARQRGVLRRLRGE